MKEVWCIEEAQKLDGKDIKRAARTISDWRGHQRPFEDTAYWSKRFSAIEDVCEKTRPNGHIVLWRNERTDIDNLYEKRFTSWSKRPELVERFGWGERRLVWVRVRPDAVMCDVTAFGPNVDRDLLEEVILKPGNYHIEVYPSKLMDRMNAKLPSLSEVWSPEERAKRSKKCANPKGFTMKQFCKNVKTRSKPGQKPNRLKETDMDAQQDYEGLLGTYSDVYKETYGYRPRFDTVMKFRSAQDVADAIQDLYDRQAPVGGPPEPHQAEEFDLNPEEYEPLPKTSGMGRRVALESFIRETLLSR